MQEPAHDIGAMPRGMEDDMLDDDDTSGDEKTKVSRWQIGSGSLGVLEQVYQMEPFPGAPCTENHTSQLCGRVPG